MGLNLENVRDSVEDRKKDVLNLIEQVKVFCFDYPTVDFNTSLPSFKNDFDVIAYLMDLLGTILGKKSQEIQRQVTKWLLENIEPLEEDIRFLLKSRLKSCFACKINPRIAPWMFVTNPDTNQSGEGINIEIDQFDFDCMLKIDPNSNVGRTLYCGTSDMNQFLYEVIQANGNPLDWVDPVTNKNIATFTYLQSAPTSGTTQADIQDTDYRNNIINMKINNSYNQPNKNFIDFINDYISSFRLFDVQKVITQSMDLIFGVVVKRANMDVACIEKKVQLEVLYDKMAKCGVDDPNVEIDNSFFQFTSQEIVDIKKQAKDRKNGIKRFSSCDNLESSIDFDSVLEINDNLTNATDKATKVEIIEKGLESISNTSANNVSSNTDKNQAKFAFLEELLNALKKVILRATLAPKTMYLFISTYYLVYGQARYRGAKDWIENLLCIIRSVLQKVIEDVSRFLLVMVLRGLKLLIIKYIRFKLKDKLDTYKKQKLSLLPEAFAIVGCAGYGGLLTNTEAVGSTIVDAGFDQAENAITNKNKSKNSG